MSQEIKKENNTEDKWNGDIFMLIALAYLFGFGISIEKQEVDVE